MKLPSICGNRCFKNSTKKIANNNKAAILNKKLNVDYFLVVFLDSDASKKITILSNKQFSLIITVTFRATSSKLLSW